MSQLMIAIGLVLFIEGLIYGGFPSAMKKMMAEMQKMPERSLRVSGFVAMLVGLFIIWLCR